MSTQYNQQGQNVDTQTNIGEINIGSKPIQCPSCDHKNLVGALFCNACGKSLGRRCRECWEPNIAGAIHCQYCRVELAQASFCVPHKLAEEWARNFAHYEWPRTIDSSYASIATRLDITINPSKETIVASSTIRLDGWLIAVAASGKHIFSKQPKVVAGGILITNRRLIVISCLENWAQSYFYENLISAEQSRTNSSGNPVFDLTFALTEKIELIRSSPPDFIERPSGLETVVAALLGNQSVNIRTIATGEQNEKINAQRREHRNENRLVVDFFRFVISEKIRL